MSNTSKAVIESNESKLKSALVKAVESWTEPYDIRPEGVFGSVATIHSGFVTLSSKTLDIEFSVPFDDDMEPNEAEITVYNLSDTTIKQLKKKQEITIEAGYEGDTGVVFYGFISKVKTKNDDADKVTTIYAVDDIADHDDVDISYKKDVKASKILRKLLEMTGLPIAVFSIKRDHTYKDGQTVSGELMQNIKQYANVCGISVYVSKGKIYARHIKEGDNINFSVSADTGMIGSPSSYEEEIKAESYTDTVNGYEVEMLLQHRMCTGAIVDLKSKHANGTYRVCSGEHRFSPDEAITTLKMY